MSGSAQHPVTFNEFIRNRVRVLPIDPVIVRTADKLAVKDWTTEVSGGRIHCVPARDPHTSENFVLKPNHTSGLIVIVKDGVVVLADRAPGIKVGDSVQQVRDKYDALVDAWANYYSQPSRKDTRERWYKHIPFGVVCEALLSDPRDPRCVTPDYKFHVFGGKVELVQIHYARTGPARHTAVHLDRNFKLVRGVSITNPQSKVRLISNQADVPSKPPTWDTMIKYAEYLARKWAYVRVDFYENDKPDEADPPGPYLSEMTFSPNAGWCTLRPAPLQRSWGDKWRSANIALLMPWAPKYNPTDLEK